MNLEKRINAFVQLGEFLSQFQPSGFVLNDTVQLNYLFLDPFKMQVKRAQENNGWFTEDNVMTSFSQWGNIVNNKNLSLWTSAYDLNLNNSKLIGVIMAGNIPLVGFHDFLSVLISGHSILVKQSSTDTHFLPLIAKFLEHAAPEFKGKIHFSVD